MKTLKQSTAKTKFIKICLIQTILFYLMTIIVLIGSVCFLPIRTSWLAFAYYVIFPPTYLMCVIFLIISKIPLIKMLENKKLKLLYLFTFIIFFYKLRNEIKIKEFTYYKKLNIALLILWSLLTTAYITFVLCGFNWTKGDLYQLPLFIAYYSIVCLCTFLSPFLYLKMEEKNNL